MSTQLLTPHFLSESLDAYKAKRGDYVTFHQLQDFGECPLYYRQKQAGLIPNVRSPALTVGAAAHTLTLEGRKVFDSRYIVGGPINPKTGNPYGDDTQAFRKWAAAQTREVITNEQYALVCQLAASVWSHEEAKSLLSAGIAEGVLRANYCGVDCQIRVDWFNPERGVVEYKTCESLRHFESEARSLGYIQQLAFIRGIIAERTLEGVPCWLVATETSAPRRTGVWQLDESALYVARCDNMEALERLKHCRETNHWPTDYERIRILKAR